MARIRTVKPDFFRSRTINRLTYEQRLTFIGLWTHVDDEGRCEYDPELIKADIWPRERSVGELEDDLRVLTELSLITHYEVGERSFIQVKGFDEHQRINRPTPSRLPPPKAGAIVPLTSRNEASPKTHGALTESSLPERKGKEGKGNTSLRSGASAPPASVNPGVVVGAWVEAFVAAVGKQPSGSLRGQAGREAKTLLDSGADPQLVVQAAQSAGDRGFATIEREYGPLAARSRIRPVPEPIHPADTFQVPAAPKAVMDDPNPLAYKQWVATVRDEWLKSRGKA